MEKIQVVREDGPHTATEDLQARLALAEDTIRAISEGEVDAVVIQGILGPQVYTLQGADHPYRVLVEQMHEGTVTLDRDGLILYANGQFASMVGASADSVSGLRFGQFLAAADTTVFREMVEAACARGHSSGELEIRDGAGMPIPARISVTLLDVAGMQNLCVVVGDLREQRRNEAIIRAEQLSRLILEQAGEAIVVIDPHGVIIRRSESATVLAGAPVLMAPFDHVFPLIASGSPFQTDQMFAGARAGEQVRGLEAKLVRREGDSSAVLVSVSPLWRAGDELLGCVITLTDITDRKRTEEALARQADELARSNSDLRQFAYSASHDLREPLRQVAVFSELLQRNYQNTMGQGAESIIQHTVDAAHRMETLLRDLLAYTQAADVPQQIEASDANEVIRKTLTTFEDQIAESGARVEFDTLPVLKIHEVHLVQLFQNLIGNALKYRSEAAPVIRISAEREGAMWKLTVADNGIGIAPDYQRQIFGLFQRLHGGSQYEGSGIGLAICQKIVQRYDGRIWVESDANCGSRFIFTLPGER